MCHFFTEDSIIKSLSTISEESLDYAPKTPDGYIYYLRLKVKSHVYYKLGFTKNPSIYRRFSFHGNEDYKYIDKILFLHHFDTAFELEQDIHSFLRCRRLYPNANRFFPFFKNGQSEIYFHDFLLLDNIRDENIKAEDLRWVNEWLEALPPYSESWSSRSLTELKNNPILIRLARFFDLIFGDWFIKKRNNILKLMPDYYQRRERFYAARAALLNVYSLRDLDRDGELQEWLRYEGFPDSKDKEIALKHKIVQPPLTGGETWCEKLWRWEALVSPKKRIFPRDEGELASMTSLDLRMDMTNAQTLPAEIGKLSNLRELTISGPMLHIPEEIGNLVKLTDLRLWYGKFHTLPESIANLKNLKVLDVPYGELRFLPTKIGDLTSLKFLGLSGNKLTDLPDSIGDLVHLEELWLAGHTSKVGSNLGWNPISHFPPTFSKLRSLKKINIGEDHGGPMVLSETSSIPREILDCKNLEELSSRYRVDGYLKEILKLKKLKKLKAASALDDNEFRLYAKKLRHVDYVHLFINKEGLPEPKGQFGKNFLTAITIKDKEIFEHK